MTHRLVAPSDLSLTLHRQLVMDNPLSTLACPQDTILITSYILEKESPPPASHTEWCPLDPCSSRDHVGQPFSAPSIKGSVSVEDQPTLIPRSSIINILSQASCDVLQHNLLFLKYQEGRRHGKHFLFSQRARQTKQKPNKWAFISTNWAVMLPEHTMLVIISKILLHRDDKSVE